MKEVLIIGNGIAGMTAAIRCAEHGIRVRLVSPNPSEWSQSVMAAGGISAVTSAHEEGDSVACHIEDTLKGGVYLAGQHAVEGLCTHAEEIIHYLESIGTVFTIDDKDRPMFRAFGGQSHKRTYYCGSATGKQIVSALIMEVREHEGQGLIVRYFGQYFHSALIRDGKCYGALIFDRMSRKLKAVYSDVVIMAVGGQNSLFGKTTGSLQCDGYAVGKLFTQGAVLKNLEFIQFHPTTLETSQKRMLISEAVRGEGGRLFYEENGQRVYFMEDKYGPRGNLMTRDVITIEIDSLHRDVFLDVSFIGKDRIDQRLSEVRDLCAKYRGIDITKEPIPIAPSVHFFMGGLAVHNNHETNIRNLYAIGECASMYHGANRLGGNSLLAAVYGGMVAADDIAARSSEVERTHTDFDEILTKTKAGQHPGFDEVLTKEKEDQRPDFHEVLTKTKEDQHPAFDEILAKENGHLEEMYQSQSPFAVTHIREMLADTMRKCMGIVRTEELLDLGIEDVDYYLSVADRIQYDGSVSAYQNYSLTGILTLARAALTCAKARQESRGAHHPREKKDRTWKKEYAHQYEIAKCLKCGICLEICPNYTTGSSFFGAVFANDCYLVFARNREKSKGVRKVYAEHFAKSCSKSLSCMDVCPKKIPTLASMAKLNRFDK